MRSAFLIALLPASFFAAGAAIALGAIGALAALSPRPSTLMEAAQLDRTDLVVRMVAQGNRADSATVLGSELLHWREGDQVTPLLVVVARGNANLLQYLFRAGTRIDAVPNDQALCVAARYGHTAAAQVLIRQNAPWAPAEGCGRARATPLDMARANGHDGLADMLSDYRARMKQ